MQPRLLATTAIAVVLSGISLLNRQAPALAQLHSIRISPAQAQQFSRDLVRSNSQDFFTQGRDQFEREIRIITQKRLFPPTPVLKIERIPQLEGDLLPSNSPNALLDLAGNHNI